MHKFTSATLKHMLDSFSLALKRGKLTPFAMAADCARCKMVTFHLYVYLERWPILNLVFAYFQCSESAQNLLVD